MIAVTQLTRADLVKVFGDNPKLIFAFEQQQAAVATQTGAIAGNAEATQRIQDATVITLSPNTDLNNERILALGPGLALDDNGPGQTAVLFLLFPITLNGGFACQFNLAADTTISLPTTGKIPSSAIGPYANDAAAAAAGVQLGEWYAAPAGVVQWRQV